MNKRDSTDPRYRHWRRRQSIADTCKPNPRTDRMRKLLDDDPEAFDSTYGARGLLILGMHEAARDAADDGPEAA